MRWYLLIFLAIIGWGTFLIRLYLRLNTPNVAIGESFIQYFSYFTILTNLLVTLYCTRIVFKKSDSPNSWVDTPELLNALTAFILFVGVIYAIALRPIWKPEGFIMVLSEIHHTLVPLGFLAVWYLTKFETKPKFTKTLSWLLYPLIYIVYVLIRGHFSDFYPYPFLDVATLSLNEVLVNSCVLLVLLCIFLLIIHFLAIKIKLKSIEESL